jgi:hypothetical protein
MLPKIINLTLLLVISEIDEVLEDLPNFPYQVAFSNQDLRNRLISDLLDQLPNYYTILEADQELPKNPKFLYSCEEERLYMRSLISQNVLNIYQENTSLEGYIKTPNKSWNQTKLDRE